MADIAAGEKRNKSVPISLVLSPELKKYIKYQKNGTHADLFKNSSIYPIADVNDESITKNLMQLEELYEFAILRIGYRGYGEEGTLNADEKFEQNMENARKAGIDVGVYFFSQAVNEEEAKEEADFVLEHLKGQELQMPVVYDPEHILEDEARTDGVTGEQFTQNAKVFCKEIEEAGYDAMIYSNMLWEAYELDLEKLLDYPVWYADYEELPQTPYRFSMWQYSSTGSVPGVEGNVDLNIQLLKK